MATEGSAAIWSGHILLKSASGVALHVSWQWKKEDLKDLFFTEMERKKYIYCQVASGSVVLNQSWDGSLQWNMRWRRCGECYPMLKKGGKNWVTKDFFKWPFQCQIRWYFYQKTTIQTAQMPHVREWCLVLRCEVSKTLVEQRNKERVSAKRWQTVAKSSPN